MPPGLPPQPALGSAGQSFGAGSDPPATEETPGNVEKLKRLLPLPEKEPLPPDPLAAPFTRFVAPKFPTGADTPVRVVPPTLTIVGEPAVPKPPLPPGATPPGPGEPPTPI